MRARLGAVLAAAVLLSACGSDPTPEASGGSSADISFLDEATLASSVAREFKRGMVEQSGQDVTLQGVECFGGNDPQRFVCVIKVQEGSQIDQVVRVAEDGQSWQAE